MKVIATLITSWERVMNAARFTIGKAFTDKEPSERWKRRILLAEHSPIRLLEYDIQWDGIRQWVTVHLVRHHIGCEKFVHTQRTDRNENIMVPRDELPQGELNEMWGTYNAQSLINVSRKRICNQASKETREAWKMAHEAIREIDPVMASKMVPECIYRGFCPEFNCCGYCHSKEYKDKLKEYREEN